MESESGDEEGYGMAQETVDEEQPVSRMDNKSASGWANGGEESDFPCPSQRSLRRSKYNRHHRDIEPHNE
jgi:hypothetical protein